jgi:hypothetical protein
MVQKDELAGTKIKHSGVFDFKETYRIMFEWLVDQNYDITEKSYKENIGAGGAKEIEIEWEATRKVADYFKFQLKAAWHIIGMTSVEVEIDGVKQKMNKGQFELSIKATLIKDYQDTWSKNAFFAFLRTLYDKYLIQERTSKFEGKLLGEMEEMASQCKSFLALTGRK